MWKALSISRSAFCIRIAAVVPAAPTQSNKDKTATYTSARTWSGFAL